MNTRFNLAIVGTGLSALSAMREFVVSGGRYTCLRSWYDSKYQLAQR
jgi:hypothetical protein